MTTKNSNRKSSYLGHFYMWYRNDQILGPASVTEACRTQSLPEKKKLKLRSDSWHGPASVRWREQLCMCITRLKYAMQEQFLSSVIRTALIRKRYYLWKQILIKNNATDWISFRWKMRRIWYSSSYSCKSSATSTTLSCLPFRPTPELESVFKEFWRGDAVQISVGVIFRTGDIHQ